MGEPREPRFHGVLVTYRRPQAAAASIEKLANQTRPLDQLLVVDNASDPTLQASLEGRERITYIDAGENLGPAGGYALGMTRVLLDSDDADWIFLFDDDDPPFFDDALQMAAVFASRMVVIDPKVGGIGISGGRFDLRSGRVSRIGDAEIEGPVAVDHITGGGLPAYRVGAVRAVGVFHKELFFGFEELEYGLRLTHAGHHLYADGEQWSRRKTVKRDQGLLPDESVSEARAARTNFQVAEPTWRRYYSLRNTIFVLRRNGATGTALKVSLTRGLLKPLANLLTAPGPAWANLKLNSRAIIDGWRGRMGRTMTPG